MMNGENPRPAGALAFLRIVLGIWFLWAGIPKLNMGYIRTGIAEKLAFFAENGAVGFYKPLLVWAQSVGPIFGWLTSVGEVAAGLGLLVGLFTPAASWAVIFMCANYLLATLRLGPASIGVNLLCLAVAAGLLAGQAGKKWGLDSLRGPRRSG